jgi:uncharacterized protein YbjT (DUF2867 family)
MHALIIGATGATGKDLLDMLLKDDAFERVDIFVRRNIHIQHKKLTTHVIDFDNKDQWKHLVKGDVLFSCLGTTLKAAGSKAAQWKIDYDYQYNFAKPANENKVPVYVLVSSGMASSKSRIFYTRMKGQLEDAVKALNFQRLIIFNPPLLVRKDTDRSGEVVGKNIINFLNKVKLFRSQKPLPTEVLAQAMINAAKTNVGRVVTFKADEIWRCAGKL